MLRVGIDIGGTKIAGGVVDPEGRIVEKLRIDTPVDTGALADAVVDMARHFGAAHEIGAVGVAAAGFMLPSVVGVGSATSCHQKRVGEPI